jgi:carboxymethylenebutenolidase
MDGLGIRPTLVDMGQRLANGGYVVLLPDLFYRAGPYEPLEPKKVFAAGDVRSALAHLLGSTDNRRAAEDTKAGTYPDRIAAAASFHGGNLATDSELSPHLLAPRMRGRLYVAGADQDDSYPQEMAERLEKALSDAGVDHRCEIYPGALECMRCENQYPLGETGLTRYLSDRGCDELGLKREAAEAQSRPLISD